MADDDDPLSTDYCVITYMTARTIIDSEHPQFDFIYNIVNLAPSFLVNE